MRGVLELGQGYQRAKYRELDKRKASGKRAETEMRVRACATHISDSRESGPADSDPGFLNAFLF